MTQVQRKFAVFDIDGTLVRNALFGQVINELVARGLFPAKYRSELDQHWEKYHSRAHEDAYGTYIHSMVDVLETHLRSLKESDFRAVVDTVLEKSRDATYVYTRDLAKELKKQGYVLIALSGSEMYTVQKFAEHHGFDIAIGETYHTENGMFTGEIEQVVNRKDKHLTQLISEHNLTLTDSIAVGDTRGDLGMLELVENPIAFNPERQLYEHAKQKGWKIVVERKNTIITLEPDTNGTYSVT